MIQEDVALAISILAIGGSVMSFITSSSTKRDFKIFRWRQIEEKIIAETNFAPPERYLVDDIYHLFDLTDREFEQMCRGKYFRSSK